MNTKPKVAAVPKNVPLTLRPQDQSPSPATTTTVTETHVTETIDTINARATSVTVVLQRIMEYDGGGYEHGGLND